MRLPAGRTFGIEPQQHLPLRTPRNQELPPIYTCVKCTFCKMILLDEQLVAGMLDEVRRIASPLTRQASRKAINGSTFVARRAGR